MSSVLAFVKEHAPKQILEMETLQVLRLVVIVCGYIFLRQAFSRHMAARQLRKQLEQDKLDQNEDRLKELVDDPKAAVASGLDNGSWGWGKKTRKVVKRQERILKEQLENLHSSTPDDDKDIEDLLED